MALALSESFTATLIISHPHFSRAFIWLTVERISEVLVLAMDCILTGCPDPIFTSFTVTVLVFLLNLRKQIEGPIVTKIYGGNFLVIRNHVYRFNQDRIFSFGKFKAVIAREFDRELVGIDDYKELVTKDFASNNPGGRVNIDDPVLIKALIAAKLTEKPVVDTSKIKWIVGGIAVVAIVLFFIFS